jgi:hypothetical protein
MDEGAREEMLPVCYIDDSRERARVDFAEIERMIPDHLGIESFRSMPDHLADSTDATLNVCVSSLSWSRIETYSPGTKTCEPKRYPASSS